MCVCAMYICERQTDLRDQGWILSNNKAFLECFWTVSLHGMSGPPLNRLGMSPLLTVTQPFIEKKIKILSSFPPLTSLLLLSFSLLFDFKQLDKTSTSEGELKEGSWSQP